MQIGMFSPRDPVYDGQNLLQRIAYVIATMRNRGNPVVFIQHSGPAKSILEPGTQGYAIHPEVAPRNHEPVFQKSTPDSFYGTGLGHYLTGHEIRHIVVCGIQTELCIDTTCRSAVNRGWQVTLIGNGHSTWQRGSLTPQDIIAHHNDLLQDWFVTLVMSYDI
jgi:nicotinamidase-related amidase